MMQKESNVQNSSLRTTKGVHLALCCTSDDVDWEKIKER